LETTSTATSIIIT